MKLFAKRLFVFVLCLVMIASFGVSAAASEATDETRGPEKAKPGIYDFVLEEQYVWIDRDRFCGKSPHSELVKRAMQAYYEDGTMNWIPATNNISLLQSENVQSAAATAFGSTDTYKWRGLRMGATTRYDGKREYVAGYWYAFTLKAPEPGVYDLNLDYMVREDGAKIAEVYFMDTKYTDVIVIDRELTDENLVGTVDFSGKSEDGKTYVDAETKVGQIDVTEEEFTIVFRAAEKVSENACCYMVITGMELTPAENAPQKPEGGPSLKQDDDSDDMTTYLLIGGGALLLVAAVVVIVAVSKKRK